MPLERDPRRPQAADGQRQSVAHKLAQPDLVEEVRAIITETGIQPELLSLEITSP